MRSSPSPWMTRWLGSMRSGVEDLADPDDRHAVPARLVDEVVQAWHGFLDAAQVEAEPAHHGTLVRAEVALHVDDDEGRVPRVDLRLEGRGQLAWQWTSPGSARRQGREEGPARDGAKARRSTRWTRISGAYRTRPRRVKVDRGLGQPGPQPGGLGRRGLNGRAPARRQMRPSGAPASSPSPPVESSMRPSDVTWSQPVASFAAIIASYARALGLRPERRRDAATCPKARAASGIEGERVEVGLGLLEMRDARRPLLFGSKRREGPPRAGPT